MLRLLPISFQLRISPGNWKERVHSGSLHCFTASTILLHPHLLQYLYKTSALNGLYLLDTPDAAAWRGFKRRSTASQLMLAKKASIYFARSDG